MGIPSFYLGLDTNFQFECSWDQFIKSIDILEPKYSFKQDLNQWTISLKNESVGDVMLLLEQVSGDKNPLFKGRFVRKKMDTITAVIGFCLSVIFFPLLYEKHRLLGLTPVAFLCWIVMVRIAYIGRVGDFKKDLLEAFQMGAD